MTRRDKIGIGVIIGLFALLGFLLVLTFKAPEGNARGPQDSIWVKQRVLNLKKSR
jgi:hypothetical protein